MPVIPSQTDTDPGDTLPGYIRAAIVSEITPMFEELRRFTDRRIAELSIEVHGAVQMVDFSETNCRRSLAASRSKSPG